MNGCGIPTPVSATEDLGDLVGFCMHAIFFKSPIEDTIPVCANLIYCADILDI
jgi:hypothetical protein